MTLPVENTPLVIRSEVVPAVSYLDYREPLRWDFFHSCAYCTITECEALGVNFSIDHYEPRSARPDLANVYDNLMYCCIACNGRKSDLVPPETARNVGIRFFRPDRDVFEEHFEIVGVRINALSSVGDFTIEAIDLNRSSLIRLRGIRQRFDQSLQYIAQGMRSLRSASLDRLPPSVRGRAYSLRAKLESEAKSMQIEFEDMLRSHTRSPFVDEDDDEVRKKRRLDWLADQKAVYPGVWRGRQVRSG